MGRLRVDGAEDRLRSDIIEQLMCYFVCDVEAVSKKHNWDVNAFAKEFETLKTFENAGLVTRDGYTVRLTSPYRQAIRSVAFVFDAHGVRGNATYSRVA